MNSLVLGVGSPFGADRLGWLAIEALIPRLHGLAEFQTSDRPGARLLALMRGYECVVIIDALTGGIAPGSMHCLHRAQLAASSQPAVHGFGVAEALALADALGELPRRLVLIGIGAGQGDAPPAVDWDELADRVRNELDGDKASGDDYS